jgi:hypothetical protein
LYLLCTVGTFFQRNVFLELGILELGILELAILELGILELAILELAIPGALVAALEGM